MFTETYTLFNNEVDREGIVVRGLEKEFSFKTISNLYLMSEK